MTRWPASLMVAAVFVGAGTAGCATTVPATVVASQCALHRQEFCRDVVPQPVRHRGMGLFAQDLDQAGNELCQALPPAEQNRLVGGPSYRYVSSSNHTCNIVSDPPATVDGNGQLVTAPRVHLQIGVWPAPVQAYQRVSGNEPIAVDGHPAWRNPSPGIGEASEQYTIGTGRTPQSGGVLLVTTAVERPRGVMLLEQPVDRAPLEQAGNIAARYAHAVL